MKIRYLLYTLPLVLLGAVLLVLYEGLEPPPAIGEGSALVGSPMPSFTNHAPDEGAWLINFFASWCVPCQAEHELLLQMAEEKQVKIVGIVFHDQPDRIDDWLTKKGNPYDTVVKLPVEEDVLAWGIVGLPETFLIDQDGIVRFHHAGALTTEIIYEHLSSYLFAGQGMLSNPKITLNPDPQTQTVPLAPAVDEDKILDEPFTHNEPETLEP